MFNDILNSYICNTYNNFSAVMHLIKVDHNILLHTFYYYVICTYNYLIL